MRASPSSRASLPRAATVVALLAACSHRVGSELPAGPALAAPLFSAIDAFERPDTAAAPPADEPPGETARSPVPAEPPDPYRAEAPIPDPLPAAAVPAPTVEVSRTDVGLRLASGAHAVTVPDGGDLAGAATRLLGPGAGRPVTLVPGPGVRHRDYVLLGSALRGAGFGELREAPAPEP